MRNIVLLSLASAAGLGGMAAAGAAADNPLPALRWKARPVIVLSDSRDDPKVARQISALDGAKQGLDERDIKVLQEAEPHGAMHRQLGVAEKGFAVVLVGKDGDVKKVWRDPVEPKRIFTIIDAMPMRRDEMKG
jgi:hypothetical protein